MKSKWLSILGVALTVVSLGACQKNKSDSASNTKKEVNLAIWSNYVTDEMLAEFEKQTGIHVNVSNYSSNEELLAKLKAGASGIDVAVPSDYMVFAMAQMGMLETLDRAQIPHSADLDAKLMGKEFDPANKYSLPWSWGTTGIAINKNLYKGSLKGWNDLFSQKALAGKFTLLDDVRESLGAALKANGKSLNSTNADEIKAAQKTLDAARSQVKAFTSETLSGLTNNEMAVAHAYSCDALQARSQMKGQIEYILPEEGCTLWVDNFVIPKGARMAEASQLVNFLLSAEVGAARTQKLQTAPANTKALALLPAELQKDTALFPSDAQLAKCEMMKDVGETLVAYDEAWTALKASQE